MTIKNKVAIVYGKIFADDYLRILIKELHDCNTVLDIGCGKDSLIQHCNVPFSVGIELYEPYLQESKKKGIHNQYIKADIRKVEFKENSFNAVLALDVIEHLSKEEGYELILKAQRWEKKSDSIHA